MAKKTNDRLNDKSDLRFKLFHELMSHKVHEVLLVSTPYDAWIMEEDCRLSEAINNEYKGLHLSNPPRLNWVSSINAALAALKGKDYDLLIIMQRTADLHTPAIVQKIQKKIAQPADHISGSPLGKRRDEIISAKRPLLRSTITNSSGMAILISCWP